MTRDFKPPNNPPAFTGELWLRPDKSIGGLISDVFNSPIHLIAVKEGDHYHVRGWRGEAPEFLRIPLEAREDGLPDDAPHDACPTCGGRLYWRASIVNGGAGGRGMWHCATCVPADSRLWLDAVAVPARKKPEPKQESLI